MKKILHTLLFCLFALTISAQESESSFTSLGFPVSSHIAALGGQNISLIDDAPAIGTQNPALYANVSDKSLGLMFMTYAAGSNLMGAQFVKAFGERHTAALSAQLFNYGSIDETDEQGLVTGSFSPSDFVLNAGYSYLFSDFVSGGANLKFLSASYGGYNAVAVAVDLGLNYYDEERDLSISVAMNNLGRQVKTFHEDGVAESLPFNLMAGVTMGLEHAPVRFSLTLTDLTRWKSSYWYTQSGESIDFGRKLLNHLVLGLDVLPTQSTYLSVGFNARRAYELKQAGGSHGTGLTFGGGLRLSTFKLGFSYAKYSLSASSLMFNLAYSFK